MNVKCLHFFKQSNLVGWVGQAQKLSRLVAIGARECIPKKCTHHTFSPHCLSQFSDFFEVQKLEIINEIPKQLLH